MIKFIEGVKRVLSHKGIVEITNSKGSKLNISDELLSFISHYEKISEENLELKKRLEMNKKDLSKLKKYSNFIGEVKTRKSILETTPHYQVLYKIHKGKKEDSYMYDGLKDNDVNLIEIFEMLDKI